MTESQGYDFQFDLENNLEDLEINIDLILEVWAIPSSPDLIKTIAGYLVYQLATMSEEIEEYPEFLKDFREALQAAQEYLQHKSSEGISKPVKCITHNCQCNKINDPGIDLVVGVTLQSNWICQKCYNFLTTGSLEFSTLQKNTMANS